MAKIEFFVLDELTGRERGPYTLDEMVIQVKKNKLKQSHLVRKSDYSKWYKAGVLLGKVFETVDSQKREEAYLSNIEKRVRRKKLLNSLAEMGRGALSKLKGSKESPEEVWALYEEARSTLQDSIKAFSGDRESKVKALAAWNACERFDEITQRAQMILKGDERIRDFEKEKFQEDIWIANGGKPVVKETVDPIVDRVERFNKIETKVCPFCGGVTLKKYVTCKHCGRDFPEEEEKA
ncbi:MAG: hypothetical protein MK106_15765 [Mariniblastus sp.]|nr:hypothetical protein [Mariniblastus sp.]